MPELLDGLDRDGTVPCVPSDIDWIPAQGAHITRHELVGVMSALQAAINGTDDDEPNRAHLVHIAIIIAQVLQRSGDAAEK